MCLRRLLLLLMNPSAGEGEGGHIIHHPVVKGLSPDPGRQLAQSDTKTDCRNERPAKSVNRSEREVQVFRPY